MVVRLDHDLFDDHTNPKASITRLWWFLGFGFLLVKFHLQLTWLSILCLCKNTKVGLSKDLALQLKAKT